MRGLTATHFRGTERFELISLLGRGANGVVYEAIDRERGARVALKVLSEQTPEGIAFFKNEFRALQEIRHPNLVELKELLFEGGHWLLVMNLVRGVDIVAYVWGQAGLSVGDAGTSPREAGAEDDTIQAREPPPIREEGAPGGTFSRARLCSSFEQIARGLLALHAANKIHRDIKRSNVLVDEQGKVTILDFGLVADLGTLGSLAPGHLLGTPSTMAPEQAALERVGPPSDWYSVGAVLYQALTGRAPFVGSREEVLRDKQQALPTAPAELDDSVPSDLSELCMALLAIEPERRPLGQTVIARLAVGRHSPSTRQAALGTSSDELFVGRTEELAVLHDALEQVRRGKSLTVVVESESGVGKTSLVRRFLAQLEAGGAPLSVFAGRCFERESLPYKALDGVMDAICSELARLPTAEVEALLPADAAAIARAFPTLRTIESVPVSTSDSAVREPHAQRLRVFAALRELFRRIAARRLTVVVLDDMQWSDIDSLAALSALLQPPHAPAILWIAIRRPGASISRVALPCETLLLALGPLSSSESGAFVSQLLMSSDVSLSATEIAGSIAEAHGHPLFLREIAGQLARSEQHGPPRLDDALWQRIEALEPGARRVLTLTAVAGQPIAQSRIAAALDSADEAAEREERNGGPLFARIADQIAELRHACLICTAGPHPNDTIEPYHDRVRETVLAHLHPSARKQSHLLLAGALERAGSSDAETLAHHWQEGGQLERAYEYLVVAADQAASALAFERAARMYRRCLELAPPRASALGEIERKLGDALANAGRGPEAAEAYQAAAEHAPSVEGFMLQRLAAEQLLRSGHVEQGIASVSRVLRGMGVVTPTNRVFAMLSLALLRARIRLRGFRYRERAESEVSALQLARIDGTWTAATCLTMFDGVRSAELQCRSTLWALSAGTPLQVLRALTSEAMFLALSGQSARARIEALLASASELSVRLGHASARAWVALSRGASAFFLGEWAEGEQQCALAEAFFHERPGASFELASSRAFLVWSAMMRGQFAQVLERVPAYVKEAEQRGDLYAATYQMTGFSNVAWLSQDDVSEARRMLGLAESRWPNEQFDVPRYLNMVAAAHIELYAGRGRAGYQRILRDWTALRWGVAFRAQITRFGMRFVRGLSALAAYDERRERALLNDAEACARAIAQERVTWSQCFAEILRYGVVARRSGVERALVHLRHAEDKATATGMVLHRAVVRHRRGEIIGGDQGQAMIEEALAFMESQGIVNPVRMLAMLSPSVS